jgi:hypothetical protein
MKNYFRGSSVEKKKRLGNADLERRQWHKNIFSVATKTKEATVHAKIFDIAKITTKKSRSCMKGKRRNVY